MMLRSLGLVFTMCAVCCPPAAADDDKAKQADKQLAKEIEEAEARFRNSPVPKDANVEALQRFVAEVKLNRPRTMGEFVVIHRKVREASRKIMELEKDKKSEDFLDAQDDSLDALAKLLHAMPEKEQRAGLKELTDYLGKHKQLGRADALLALQAVRGLESRAPRELTTKAYKAFTELFEKAGNQPLADVFAGGANRLNLPGNPIDVTGVTFDGKEFDIKTLKGKVVLIDFWATWCGPCVREHPNIMRLYDKYKEKGFEVVGISLDTDRQVLKKYIEEKEVAWINLHDRLKGMRHPVAVKYGISSIPAMFLVGRDGKVVSLQARGAELIRLLKKEFGE